MIPYLEELRDVYICKGERMSSYEYEYQKLIFERNSCGVMPTFRIAEEIKLDERFTLELWA